MQKHNMNVIRNIECRKFEKFDDLVELFDSVTKTERKESN